MPNYEDQRANPRFRCRCYATLDATEESWPAHLLNLSSCGALVAVLNAHKFQPDQRISLTVELEDADDIVLSGEVAHVKEHYVGVKSHTLDEKDALLLQEKLDSLSTQN